MKLYHVSNGVVYGPAAKDVKNLKEYAAVIRKAYGSLRGIRIYSAENAVDAYNQWMHSIGHPLDNNPCRRTVSSFLVDHAKSIGKRAAKSVGRRVHAAAARKLATLHSRYLSNPAGIRIVHNKLLGGWYVVRGPHQTPLNGRFDSKAAAQAWLLRKNPVRRKVRKVISLQARLADQWFNVKHFSNTAHGKEQAIALGKKLNASSHVSMRVITQNG